MRVEVDFSDLDELAYYIDQKSEKLEKVLKKDSKCAEYRVKRQHWGGDGEFDTYVIQNADGVDLVSLNTWEIDTLSEDEILSYTDVQIRREPHSYIVSAFVFVLILAIFGTTGVMFTLFEIAPYNGTLDTMPIAISTTSSIIVLLAIIWFYRKRKQVKLEKHQIDILAARENSSFLSALRKLASLTGENVWMHDEFKDRLKYIEDALEEVR
ncbi:MAG: hypothetical protein E4H14_17710 [Candidatus Thorarchaeota archaeon]|nr:MAG: hypothetical protein E4H14_17710 [Candidatus Thorarchaeota archaeon]